MISVVIPSWDLSRATHLKKHLGPELGDVHIPLKAGAVEAMALGAEMCKGEYTAFFHDDIEIHDQDWVERVENFFAAQPRCGMVGFGGAAGLGTADIYKHPYDLHQMARLDFMSNMVDAEQHGRRITEPEQGVVLDGFAQIIRKTAYEEVGGWETILKMEITFHMYDAAMACLLARKGWEVWVLPVSCTHHGGRTSTTPEYDAWLRKQGVHGDSEVHQKAHRIVYKEFRDVLPLRVGG